MNRFRYVALSVLVGVWMGSVPAVATIGANSRFEAVTMIYVGGEQCVVVDKMRAKIYRDRNPKRVKWQVTVGGHYWEIRYQASGAEDPEKGDGQGDFFSNSGTLDIGCGQSDLKTDVPAILAPANATWPYLIKVYECDGGARGRYLCELDPNIDWGDG